MTNTAMKCVLAAMGLLTVGCGGSTNSGSNPEDTMTPAVVVSGDVQRDIIYARPAGSDPALTSLDIYPSAGPYPAPTLIFVHGGGWKVGDKSNIEMVEFVDRLHEAGWSMVAINTRLVQDDRSRGTTPADMTTDVAKAIRWVWDRAEQYGVDRARIVLLGYSSGAHLVALVGTDPKYLGREELAPSDLYGILPLDVSAYDVPRAVEKACELNSCFSARNLPDIFGSDIEDQIEQSPVTHIRAGATYPPFQIISAGIKDRNPQTMTLDQSQVLLGALQGVGATAAHHHEPDLDHTQLMGEMSTSGTDLNEVVFNFLASPTGEATPPSMPPTGMGCETLQAKFNEVFAAQTAGLSGPGGVVAAVRTPCGAWTSAAGMANADDAMTPNHVVRIGSVTKTYTAAMILQLIDEGALSLDTPLSTWLPMFPNAQSITVEHLLRHTSGTADLIDNSEFMMQARNEPDRAYSPMELLQAVFMMTPDFEPGTSWGYSNTNFLLLGVIIQQVATQSYAEALNRRLLIPLGLMNTKLDAGGPLGAMDALGYSPTGQDVSRAIHPSVRWAAGAVAATAGDVAAWGEAFLGGKGVISDALYGQASQGVPTASTGMYGLGFGITEVNGVGTVFSHGGESPGFHTQLQVAPVSEVSVAVTSTFNGQIQRSLTALLMAAAQP